MSNDNMKEPKRGPGPGRGPLGRGQGMMKRQETLKVL